MSSFSRRDFMIRSAAAGALGLGAGNLMALEPAAAPAMTIARWTGPKQLNPAQFKEMSVKLTEQTIAAMGGMKRFVKQGDVVWVKPNIGWDRAPEFAANTNPDVVATIIRLCFDAGAKKVKIGDNPCNPAPKTYQSSGIAPAAKALGAEVVFLDPSRFKETAVKGERLKTIGIFPEIVESDLVINIPIVKHHVIAGLTMAMKNYMGVVDNRKVFHQAMAGCLADITRFMKPQICVMDCTRVLVAHGPRGGKLDDVVAKLTLAAGTDIVALDAFGAEIMGKKPQEFDWLVNAEKVGLGKIDYRSLGPKELAVA